MVSDRLVGFARSPALGSGCLLLIVLKRLASEDRRGGLTLDKTLLGAQDCAGAFAKSASLLAGTEGRVLLCPFQG